MASDDASRPEPAARPGPRRPPSALRRWGTRLAVLAVLVGAGVGLVRLLPKKTLPIRGLSPQRGEVRDVVSSSTAGEVTPEHKATMRAEVGGRVLAVLYKSGARVRQGEVIVRLDEADLRARLFQAQASVTAAAGQLAQAEARIATLTRQAERARTLLQRGAGTAQLSEDADAALREAQKALQAARGQVAQAQGAAQVARVARERAEIKAPFAGLLTEVLPGIGDTLAMGAPVLEIMDDSRLHVDATIDEADAARVRIDQQAELRLDALPGETVRGRVSKVDPAVKRDLKGARTLGVEVEVLDVGRARERGLKPGMSANVDIVVARKDKVLSVPTSVIIGRGVSRSVYLLVPEGRYHRVKKTEVQVGISNWERTELLSGVGEADVVAATLNQKGLEDGALVQLQRGKDDGAAP